MTERERYIYIPLLQVLDTCHPPLGISDHLSKQKRKRGTTQIGLLAAIEVSVVDGFAVRGHAQAARRLLLDDLALADRWRRLFFILVGRFFGGSTGRGDGGLPSGGSHCCAVWLIDRYLEVQ